jgi:hypothetical protein
MRNRKTIIIIVIILVLAVVSLGIAFAAFSTTLNIDGSASVESSNWDVFFATTSNGSNPGSTGVSLPSNGIYKTGKVNNISTLLTKDTFTWSANFISLDDYLSLDFYVRNTGDYDAIPSFSGATCELVDEFGYIFYNCQIEFTCTQNGVVTAEAAKLCDNLYATFQFAGETLSAHSSTNAGLAIFYQDYTFADDGSDLPKNPVTVTATPITITATQSSSAH